MKNFFDAVKYTQHNRVQRLLAAKLLAQNYDVINGICPPAKVFDAGCGAGGIDKVMASSFYNIDEIIAVDISDDMISTAKSINGDLRIEYHTGDISDTVTWPSKLQALQGQVDLVTSFGTLHWPKDPSLAARNFCSTLKPGGILLGWTVGIQDADKGLVKLQEHLKTSQKWLKFYQVSCWSYL